MWNDISNTKLLVSRHNPSPNQSLIIFDFPTLIDKMKHKNAWAKGDLDTIILVKTPTKQIVLTALHGGTEINSFQSNESINFQIIEGRLKFHTRKESVSLGIGQLLTLQEKIKYRLTTDEETVLLLTITNSAIQLSDN